MTMMTTAGGMAMGTPDVCNTPTPGGDVPTPYPNICQFTMADSGTCSSKVKAASNPVCVMNTEISMSSGDEAGVSGGLVSGSNMDVCKVMMGSTKVMAENKGVAVQGGTTGHNGSTANAVGSITLASVPTVTAMP
ncbi:MAG: DUF4150 domain-containing protein [Planctomycetes bacterium]|nr:DUF4150 domain-containing protein [Planctomycetota bacterium]